MLKLNPATGQYEDDGTPAIDPSLGTMSEPLAQAATTPPVAAPPPVVAPPPTPAAPATPVVAPVKVPKGASETQRQLADAGSIATDMQAANTADAEAKATTAQNKATAASNAADVLAQQQQDAARKEITAKSEMNRLQGISEAEDAKYKNAGFRDYWADKSTGTKVLATISMALGTLGQGLAAAGGTSIPNTALQLINNSIERDWEKQKADILKQKDVAEMADHNTNAAKLALDAAQAATVARQKDAIAAAIEKAALANGAPEARANGAVLAAKLRQDALSERQRVQQTNAQLANLHADTILKGAEANKANAEAAKDLAMSKGETAKPATESQGKANAMLTVMTSEAKRIETLPPLSEGARNLLFQEIALKNAAEKNPGTDYIARLAGLRKTIDSRLKGTDKQSYEAYTAFLDPLVRQRTGANAPPSEVAALASPIIPAPGDKAPELSAKRQRRREAIESFAEQSNQRDEWRKQIAGIYEGGGAAPAGPSAAPPPGAVRGNYKGRPGYMLNGRFFPDDAGGMAAR